MDSIMNNKIFRVSICISTEAEFSECIEADTAEEAERIASDRIWADEYTRELRACQTITDEEYVAEEECLECGCLIDIDCECEEDSNV